MHEIHNVELFWSKMVLCLKWRLLIGQDFAELIIFQRTNFQEIFLLYLFMNIHEKKLHLNNVPPYE